jgi:Ca-activated chloride channel family protein
MGSEFTFQAIYWLLLLPLVLFWLYWRKKRSMHWPQFRPVITIRYPLLNDLNLSLDKSTQNNKRLVWLGKLNCDQMIALSFCFMIIALAQPITYKTPLKMDAIAEQSVNIILVLDTALSMSLKDYQMKGLAISRLSMAQSLLNSLVDATANNKMALLLLSNPPALWLPLTDDKAVLKNAISRTSTLLGGRISDMGASLNFIADEFKDDKDKTIVLLSDGGTQVGNTSPQDAAKQLQEKGFTLYVIAMGAAGKSAQAYDNSSLIYEPANLKRLQLVIDESNGQLFHAKNEQDYGLLLPLLKKPINQSDIIPLEQQFIIVYYPMALFIAMLLLFYVFFIQTCQTSSNKSKGVNHES